MLRNAFEHLLSGLDLEHLDAVWDRKRHGSRHDLHVRSPSPRRGCQGEPHPTRGSVADEPHRVDRFAGGPCRDEHLLPPQWRRIGQRAADLLDDLVRLEHPPGAASLASSQRAGSGARYTVRQRLLQVSEVGLRLRVGIHAVVHRRTDENRSPRGQQRRGEQVVGPPMGRPGNEVGRRRRHTHDVGLGPELDVERGSLGRKQFGRRGSTRNGIERERLDEPLGPAGKNRVDLRAEPRQIPGELNGLIGGDAPGDAEDDPPSLPRASGVKYTSRHRSSLGPHPANRSALCCPLTLDS